ncbi:MAG: dethiobiotin synthase [Planctomycetota bacterium]
MFEVPVLTKPGLFVTGTDTEVGKTVVSCAIAAAIREQHRRTRLGVLKPFASGCRQDRDGLVNEDAEALAHFADCRLPMDVVNPIRFRTPVAPAAAAEIEKQPVDWSALSCSLSRLDEASDMVLVEGCGGLMVPLDPRNPRFMVGELAEAIGYPVVVVCRPNLGTLNHTLMTVELLRQAGCRVSGLVINGLDRDPVATAADPSIASNRDWLERLTGVKVLAALPKGRGVNPAAGKLDPGVIAAALEVNWLDVMRVPVARPPSRFGPEDERRSDVSFGRRSRDRKV